MRGVNLVLKRRVQLADWRTYLDDRFPSVHLDYSEGLARREGLPEHVTNELVVEDGDDHVFVLERPTTIREYEPEELEALRQIIGNPEQFLAVGYTDGGLLRRILAVLLTHEGRGKVVVEDEDDNLAFLEDFLETGEEG